MATANCANARIAAIASLYAYDDPRCHQADSTLTGIGGHNLKFVEDAMESIAPNERGTISHDSNFQGALYCDVESNVLMLVFRGSVSLTPLTDRNAIEDWYNTNLTMHLGTRPLQYSAAEDAAWLIKRAWSDGHFDRACGPGRPRFMLAGYSKGGGQAQYAAVRNDLVATVFNSDVVNPLIFSDWMLTPAAPTIWDWMRNVRRSAQSLVGCATGQFDGDLKSYIDYFSTGRIEDVRMVNDPLIGQLFGICGDNLPHAPFEWLVNTLDCSNNGHAILTVIRELQACAP